MIHVCEEIKIAADVKVTVIDGNIERNKSDVFLAMVMVDKSKDWLVYILQQTVSVVTKGPYVGPRELWVTFTKVSWFQGSMKNDTFFSLPYHSWQWEPNNIVTNSWTIHAYSSFAINLTIWKAYVPYSRGCKDDVIAFSDINLSSIVRNIWWSCGHMINDSTYGKSNMAKLAFSLSSMILPFPAMINASYQVMQSGLAYVFPEAFVPNKRWGIPRLPNVVFYNSGQWMFIWFISNQVLTDGTSMRVTYINITSFTCRHKGSLLVFPGLLTLHQIMWRNTPVHTMQCNRHAASNTIKLTFHMYATLVFNTLSQDNCTRLHFTFAKDTVAPHVLHSNITLITDKSLSYLKTYKDESHMSFAILHHSKASHPSFKFLLSAADVPHGSIKISQMQLPMNSVEGAGGGKKHLSVKKQRQSVLCAPLNTEYQTS